jgi:hypothetical protein
MWGLRGKVTPCSTCPKPDLWDENIAAWEIFTHLASQARTGGMGGFTGFDYTSLPVLFTAYGIGTDHWAFYLDKFRILTDIALRFWNAEKPGGK